MQIGFIGAGQMASALAQGLLNTQAVKASDIFLSDMVPALLAKMEALGCRTTPSNELVVKSCDVIILAVKPQVLDVVLKGVADVLTAEKLVISIAAGVSLASLQRWLGREDARLVRVMPNINALVQQSASVYCCNKNCGPEDEARVTQILGAAGTIIKVAEYQLDAVTGVSGSGPAYVFTFLEALADAGVRSGLPRDLALSLAKQTVFGSVALLNAKGFHPAAAKDIVCSPGGTTIEAVYQLEKHGFRAAVHEAVAACAKRSAELGREQH